MIWTPRTTVAAVIEQDGRFLMVEEIDRQQRVLNQPAGHLEDNESLIQAVIREVAEETCMAFEPKGLLGIYRYRIPRDGDSGLTYLRYAFLGSAEPLSQPAKRDPDILDLHWLTEEQMRSHRLRSPMVLQCVQDYRRNLRYPLELLHEID